jgi:hypothetical protein
MGEWIYIHLFFSSSLDGGEWSASRPGRFTSGERTPGIHWIGEWVDSRTGLDDVEEKNLAPTSNSGPSAVQLIASRYTDWPIPSPIQQILFSDILRTQHVPCILYGKVKMLIICEQRRGHHELRGIGRKWAWPILWYYPMFASRYSGISEKHGVDYGGEMWTWLKAWLIFLF